MTALIKGRSRRGQAELDDLTERKMKWN